MPLERRERLSEDRRISIVGMLADPHAAGVLELHVACELHLGVLALQVAEDDDRVRAAVAVSDRLQPRRFLDGLRRAAIAFDVHGLDDVRAVELLEEPLDAPIRSNHLVVPEALVVSGRPRIPKPAVGEALELPEVMVRLDEWDAAIDLCGHPVLVRLTMRRVRQRGPRHDPPGRSGSDGCAANGWTSTDSQGKNGSDLIAAWRTLASCASQSPQFARRPGTRQRRRIRPSVTSSSARTCSAVVKRSSSFGSPSPGHCTSMCTRNSTAAVSLPTILPQDRSCGRIRY